MTSINYTSSTFPQLSDEHGARNAVRQWIVAHSDWERMARENGYKPETRFITKDVMVFCCNAWQASVSDILRRAGIDPLTACLTPDPHHDANIAVGSDVVANTTEETLPAKTEPTAPVADVSTLMQTLKVVLNPETVDSLETAIKAQKEQAISAALAAVPTPDPVEKVVYINQGDGETGESKGHGFAAQSAGDKPFAEVFGTGRRSKAAKAFAERPIKTWHCPTAPQPDPNYMFPVEQLGLTMVSARRGENVFLYGPRATGKSKLCKEIAARTGAHFCRIGFEDQMDMAELIGQNVPVPSETGGTDWQWQDGILLKAVRTPGTVILLDEISGASPGDLLALNTALDMRAIHVKATSEIVPFADGVVIIAADNTDGFGDETGNYGGTKVMNEAFMSRFQRKVKIDRLSDADMSKVLQSYSGCSGEVAGEIVKVLNASTRAMDSGKLSTDINIRAAIAFATDIADDIPATMAFETCILSTLPSVEREAAYQELQLNGLSDDQWAALQRGERLVHDSDESDVPDVPEFDTPPTMPEDSATF